MGQQLQCPPNVPQTHQTQNIKPCNDFSPCAHPKFAPPVFVVLLFAILVMASSISTFINLRLYSGFLPTFAQLLSPTNAAFQPAFPLFPHPQSFCHSLCSGPYHLL